MPWEFFKSGMQSDGDDPWLFVMSTSRRDSFGDIIEQDWDLRQFRQNPIALFQHKYDTPIGIWEDVDVVNGQLMGRLKLAEPGTSYLIDSLRKLVQQRILRAVSVNLISKKVRPVDPDRPQAGMILSGNVLRECSLVSVPANPDALAVVKGFNVSAECVSKSGKCAIPAFAQMRAQQSRVVIGGAMSISEKIIEKRREAEEYRQQIESLAAGDMSDDARERISALSESLERVNTDLEALAKAEAATARSAQPVNAGAETRVSALPRAKGFIAFGAIATMMRAHCIRASAVDVAEREMRDYPEVAHVVRDAVSPASVSNPTWAGNLVRQTWGEFFDLLRDRAVYPRLPGVRFLFDGNGVINFPVWGARGALKGHFVADGSSIPVASGSVETVEMSPKRLKVISTFTKELAARAVPFIQSIIQDQILGDTAEAVDTYLFDDIARSAVRPAGLQNTAEVGAANVKTATSAGATATASEIFKDVTDMLSRVYAARMGIGGGGVWVMNGLQRIALERKQDGATGEYPFRDDVRAGVFFGYPIIESANVPNGIVAFVAQQAMAFGAEMRPSFEVSDQATLHMSTEPAENVGSAPASEVRSLFQTDTVAVKMVTGLDWRVMRTGGVQVLTGATKW